MTTWTAWLRALLPAAVPANRRERLRVVVGALLGIGLTALSTRWTGGHTVPAWPLLIAPMGATAVLIFGVPASPLAQPWSVIGGHGISALVGVACARWIGPTEAAAALAVGGAIAAMLALRCLHPPGGATALLAVISGATDPGFALQPVLANAAVLTVLGMVYNPLTRRAYPHPQLPPHTPAARDREADAIDADLEAVLARYNQVLAVSRDELKAMLQDSQLRGYQRRLADLRCRDIMSTRLVTVSIGTPLTAAWALFRQHRIKALPVVDISGAIVGIVTPADFLRAAEVGSEDRFDVRSGKLRSWAGAAPASQDVVGRIMSRQVRVARADRHLAELVPLFGSSGHHHIPIVEDSGRLVGIVTQSDVVAALAESTTAAHTPAPV